MPEGFRTLAELLNAHRAMPDEPAAQQAPPEPEPVPLEEEALDAVMRDVRLFHVRIAERLETALDDLLSDIAATVLARELQLAPAAIDAIVGDALARLAAEEPVRVRVHPADAARVTSAVPVLADAALREGDAEIDVRDGVLDCSLGVRLAHVLSGFRP